MKSSRKLTRSSQRSDDKVLDNIIQRSAAPVLCNSIQDCAYRIAAALGCSESAVKSLLFRAYETLRQRLGHLAGGRS